MEIEHEMAPLTRFTAAAALTLTVAAGSTAAAGTTPTLDAAWPSRSAVTVGTPLVVTGTATEVESGATVSLQYALPTGWHTVTSTAVADDGSWQLPVPTGWLHHPLGHRVLLDGSDSVSDTWSLRVRPSWRPPGRRSSWSGMDRNHVLRWNPCDVVTWRLNPRGAPRGAARVAREAVRRTAQATGLRFEYLGRTRHVPRRDRPAPAGTDLAVSWVYPRQTDLLSSAASGAAGVQIATSGRRIDGRREWLIASAGVAMNRSSRPPRLGFRGGNSLGAILMHELGHAVGLAHVPQRSRQIMVPVATPGPGPRWGAGDLAGLEYLGLKQGCGGETGAARAGAARVSRTASTSTYVVQD